MRKLAASRMLMAFVLASLAVVSCKKIDKQGSKDAELSNTNDFKFLNSRLKQFAVDFAPALSNASARAVIREKAKEKFDEEYEVLIKDLFSNSLIQSLVPVEKSRQLHNDLFLRSGEHLYPQIYIPRLQYLEDKAEDNPAFRVPLDSTTEDPIYTFYSGDAEVDSSENDEIYPGYRVVDGALVFYTMVDENYANEHEVWIFSLNESVDDLAKLPVPCDLEGDPCGPGCPITVDNPNCGGGGGGGGGTGGGGGSGDPDDDPTDAPARRNPFPELNHNKISFMIQYMRVRTHNESWLAGASEISIRAKLVCHNGRHEGAPGAYQEEYTSDQYSNYLGRLIKKVKRKQIKHQDLLTVNYTLQSNWQNEVPNQDPVHFVYIMFERDIWPAKLNTDTRYAPVSLITGEQPPGGFSLNYRSGGEKKGFNWPYARYYFTNTLFLATSNNYAGSGLVENQDIAFNTVLN